MGDLNSLFLTTSSISTEIGGGNVCYHIIQALQKYSNLTRIYCNGTTSITKTYNINPVSYGLPDNPFLWDYLASRHLPNLKPINLVHIYGNPFGVTVDLLKNYDIKIFVDVPAHNLEESIREFKTWNLEYPYHHMIDPILWKYYIQHIIKADVIITPSKYSADYISTSEKFRKHFLHKPIIKIIPHGCNPPEDTPGLPDEIIVGHLGQNGLDKGQIYLLQAWLKIKDIPLYLAGDRTEYWKPVIEKYNINVKIFGRIENKDSFYRNISIYLQSSVCDGFGIPVLEAMSYGRPVIVTEGVGAKDLVVDGFNGFIIPIRKPEAIVEKIQYFIDNPSEIKRMGVNARATARNYTWDKIIERYLEVYNSIL